jgi:hypothetical protein
VMCLKKKPGDRGERRSHKNAAKTHLSRFSQTPCRTPRATTCSSRFQESGSRREVENQFGSWTLRTNVAG